MKNVNLKVVLSGYIKYWYLAVLTVIICAGIFAYNGYSKATKEISDEKKEEIAEYEKALADYDEAIENVVQLRAEGEAQIKEQQEYNDNSIYMKLNPNDYAVASLQYTVVPEEGTDIGRVLSAYVQYINTGSFYTGIASMTQVQGLTEAYLKELGWVGTNGNILIVTIMMPDDEGANAVLKSAKMAIGSRHDAIAIVQGGFELELLEESVYHSSSLDMLNRQMGAVNNLKGYLNAAADYETKEVNTRASKDSYIEKNEPENMEPGNPRKELVKGGILGAVIGFVISFAIAVLLYIMSDKLKSYEDMLFANIAVIARRRKGKFVKDTGVTKEELAIMAKSRGVETDGVLLYPVGDISGMKEAADELEKSCELVSSDSLTQVADKGNAILLVWCGHTTYGQIEEARRVLEQLKVDVWGCVVVE